jgi:hypothetical protein
MPVVVEQAGQRTLRIFVNAAVRLYQDKLLSTATPTALEATLT